jgi:hypothetical protein
MRRKIPRAHHSLGPTPLRLSLQQPTPFSLGGTKFYMETVYLVRYQGQWKSIRVKPFEPERMTTDIAWLQIKEGLSPEQAYVRWFAEQRKLSRLLQQWNP